MKQLRLGVIGVKFRYGITRFFHNPEGDSVITAVAELNDKVIQKF